jgi:predicted 3-demethylubiquinone-9 3-methyltransferase (glyoxalase superfamily)
MNNQIYPCLWFNGQAKEAAELYCNAFGGASAIVRDTPMVVTFEIEGKRIMGLNGGPQFTISPALSFFVTYYDRDRLERLWQQLAEGGSALMALGEYPWAPLYGWVKDRFGTTWQLMLGELPPHGQTVHLAFLFANTQLGRAREAIDFYTDIFPQSVQHHQELYRAGEPVQEGFLKFGHFSLNGETLAAMDGPGDHTFAFGEGFSLVVECDTQEQIDHYWKRLTEGGAESQCGWLKDRFGVSWQIVPSVLKELMGYPAKAPTVMAAFLKMKKFDIATLLQAAEGVGN